MRIPRAHKLTLACVDEVRAADREAVHDGQPERLVPPVRPQDAPVASSRRDPSSSAPSWPSTSAASRRARDGSRCCSRSRSASRRRATPRGRRSSRSTTGTRPASSSRSAAGREAAIELFGLVCNQEALMNSSFLELLREEVGNYYTDMVRIDGGTDQLPHAFLPFLRDRIRFGARMIAIDQSDDGVTVHYQTAAGRSVATGDYAIVTVPFPVLRHVEVLKPFSHAKQRAIRQLHYDASAKIFFQCRRRFWEDDDGIVGGGTVTDLADPQRLLPRSTAARPAAACCSRATRGPRTRSAGARSRPTTASCRRSRTSRSIHPQVLDEFEVGASKMWHDDEYAGGAFALFDPSSRRCCTSTSSRPRAASTSRASTRRSPTRGSRARSSRGCAPRARSMRSRCRPTRAPFCGSGFSPTPFRRDATNSVGLKADPQGLSLWVGLQPDAFPSRCDEHRRPEGRPTGAAVVGRAFSPTSFHRDATNSSA